MRTSALLPSVLLRSALLPFLLLLLGCPGEKPTGMQKDGYWPRRDTQPPRPREWRAYEASRPRPLDGSGPRIEASTATTFVDVPASSPFASAITWVAQKNYLTGCKPEPPTFCPDEGLLRDWAAVSVIRMKLGETFTAPTTPYFTDVPASHWAFKYIQKLYEMKGINGCGDGTTYCPQNTLSRGQAAALLVRMKFGDSFTPAATPYFTDVPATHWAFKYVQKLYDAGVTAGCGATTFCPDQPIKRSEWAAFLFRLQTL